MPRRSSQGPHELRGWAILALVTLAGCNSGSDGSSGRDSHNDAGPGGEGSSAGANPGLPAPAGFGGDSSGRAGSEDSDARGQGSGGTGAPSPDATPGGFAGAHSPKGNAGAGGDAEGGDAAGADAAGGSNSGPSDSGSGGIGPSDVDAGVGGRGSAGSADQLGAAGTAGPGAGGSPTEPPRDPCEPELAVADPKVTVAATFHCSTGTVSIAPLSQDDTALVAASSGGDVYVAELSPNGVSLGNTGIQHAYVQPLFLFVDDADAPWLMATARDESGISLWTPAEPVWKNELIVPSDYTEYSGFLTPPALAAAVSSAGNPLVFYQDGGLVLAERRAPSQWVETDVSDALDDLGAMAVDTLGRIRIVHARAIYTGKQVEEWTDGNVLPYGQEDSGIWSLAGAAGLGGTFGVARVVDEGTVVSVSDGNARLSEQVIAEARGLPSTQDCSAHISCAAYSCDVQGATRVAMTSTSDGAFWVVYNLRHFDLGYTLEEDADGTCQTTGGEDRSSEQLVLVHVSPDAQVAPSVRWSVPIQFDEIRDLQLAARGSSLYLGVTETDATHVFGFDWTSL